MPEGKEPETRDSAKNAKTMSRAFFVLCCLALGAGLALLAALDPSDGVLGRIDLCVFHSATGLNCAGCGSTRALHALLRGEILQAFAYNPLATLLSPFAAYLLLRWGLSVFAIAALPLPKARLGALALLGALILAFTLARNLPYEPCKALAPHKLQPKTEPQRP